MGNRCRHDVVDYYTRVEQGRLAPSPLLSEALCRVLQLNPEQTAYAEDLLNRAPLLRPGSRGRGRSTTAAARSAPGAVRPGYETAPGRSCLERVGDGATHQFLQSPGSPAH